MKKFALVIVAALMLGCSSPHEARQILTGAGYTDIEITGYNFTGCDEKDSFHTGFKAKGPTGVAVEGVVCSGWLKGGTIRF